jgi:hypothetical protein
VGKGSGAQGTTVYVQTDAAISIIIIVIIIIIIIIVIIIFSERCMRLGFGPRLCP